MKQIHKEKKTYGCHGEGGWWSEGLGVWSQQKQTITYRMDKQRGPMYSTGKNTQYPVTNHNGKIMKKSVYIFKYN